MAWFKVDDRLWGHPKWLMTPPRARGLWVTAGSWSASNETDGAVPAHVLATLGGTRADAKALVNAGLWITESETTYRFHGWADFQPTRAELDEKREADRQRKAEWRARKNQGERPAVTDTSQSDAAVTPDGVRAESALSRPDPTRPDPFITDSPGRGTSPKQRASNEHDPQPCGTRHDPARPCRGCAKAAELEADRERRDKSERATTAAKVRARENQEAIDACDMCGPDGRLASGRICPHVESTPMPEALRESIKGGRP